MDNLFRRYDFFNRENNNHVGFCFARNRDSAMLMFKQMVDVDKLFDRGVYCVDNSHMCRGHFEFFGDKNEISDSSN